jgi:hypothetical protein
VSHQKPWASRQKGKFQQCKQQIGLRRRCSLISNFKLQIWGDKKQASAVSNFLEFDGIPLSSIVPEDWAMVLSWRLED